MSPQASQHIWEPPAPGALVRWPLPHQTLFNGWVVRALAMLARRQVLTVHGLDHVTAEHDPFILAINHSTRTEALLVPAVLVLLRGGKLIHFLADWNFRLIPGIGLIYRRAETVVVTRKPAKPRILNALKPLYAQSHSTLVRAQGLLGARRSIGLFPEGRVNRDPQRLLPGNRGAAFLSLKTGVPVIPAGIRFPFAEPARPIADTALMEVHIGRALVPPHRSGRMSPADVQAWHSIVMKEVSRLSGKSWSPNDGA